MKDPKPVNKEVIETLMVLRQKAQEFDKLKERIIQSYLDSDEFKAEYIKIADVQRSITGKTHEN